MNSITRRGAVFGATGLAATAAPASVTASVDSPQLPAIDQIFADATPAGGPGYAIGVIKNGAFVHAAGYGLANIDDNISIGLDTSFHIASLSKQFTGAAVALTILDGKLTFEDRVADHVPEMAWAPQLQVQHLIYMTSGLPEYSSLPRDSGLPWFSPYRFTTQEAIATVAHARRLDFQAGAQWAYRNINFMLLAEIVARIQAKSFATFLRERVFLPLDMANTLVDDDALAPIPHRAIGYAPSSPDVLHDLTSVHIDVSAPRPWLRLDRVSPHYGGSGVFTSINDWLKWDQNWRNPRVGGRAFVELMHKRMRFAHDKDNDALGLVFGTRQHRSMIWYSGGDLDASSYVARFPDQNATLICLSNNPRGEAEMKTLQAADALIHSNLI